MAEVSNAKKESEAAAVVNEDEEADVKEAEEKDEEMAEVEAAEDIVEAEAEEEKVEEEMKEKVSTQRTHNPKHYTRGGRGGRGGRHARRHVPYRNNDDGGSGGNSDRSRRVYVGNLSWDVTWRELKDYMKTTGCEVTRADVMLAHDGRSKGCGIVEFATVDGARRAVLTLNDTELHGRQIFVREDREEGFGGRSESRGGGGQAASSEDATNAQSRRVYVGNIPWDVAWQDLKDHMRQAGEVLFAEVLKNPDGRSKGCGIVEFSEPSEAKEAISLLNDSELNGRMIFVREDRENANASAMHDSEGDAAPTNNSVTSVYVGNVSFECSWQDLKDHMRQAGNVDQANILHFEDGRSKGCAIVTYQKPHDAQRAIRELQNSMLHDRPIFIREDREQASQFHTTQPLQLFVGNLSYDTNWRDLKHHFRQCGEVERAEVMEGPDGRKRGYGTVRFYRSRDAQSAIRRLNGVDFMGRRLEVRVDHKAD